MPCTGMKSIKIDGIDGDIRERMHLLYTCNRLDQTNVERLVRMHTNLLLSGRLEAWSALLLVLLAPTGTISGIAYPRK